MLVPLVCSIIYREPDTIAFIISAVATTAIGLLLTFTNHTNGGKLSTREALFIVGASWIVVSAFSAIPYMLAGTFHSYLNAYFEAMSGLTTTGATVLNNIESQPHGILLWRDFTQWLGGLGIVSLFVAVLPMMGIGTAHLVQAEVPAPQAERFTPKMRGTAQALWQTYLGMTAILIILLFLAGMPLYDAFATAFGTMATGGFSPKALSIAAYNSPAIEIIIILFMVIAGINFSIYYAVFWKRNFGRIIKDTEFRTYLGILIVTSIVITLDLVFNGNYSLIHSIRSSIFHVVSIQTTTGFVTDNFDAWPALSRAVLLILMFIGASAGSTGGGFKVVRVVVLVKYAYRALINTFNPKAVIPIRLEERTLTEGTLNRILGFTIIWVLTFAVAFLIMSALGLDLVSALSSVAATISNVGPGLGMVGPMLDYSIIPPIGKIVLICCMLVGRLELWAVFALFAPAFWRWR